MTLSILIISIGERFEKLITLYNKINDQIKDYPVEIICFTDNRKRTIGEKRTGAPTRAAEPSFQVLLSCGDHNESAHGGLITIYDDNANN